MNENKTALLKIFSTVLRDRAKSEPQYQAISSEMGKYFSRKELIEIITHIYQDEDSPWENNLVEMENEELLLLIKDDYSIISYVTGKWSKEVSQLPTKQEWIDAKIHSSAEKESEENSELKSEETASENLEHSPVTETISEHQDSDSETSKKKNSEASKPSDVSSENKKTEEKTSSKKPEKTK